MSERLNHNRTAGRLLCLPFAAMAILLTLPVALPVALTAAGQPASPPLPEQGSTVSILKRPCHTLPDIKTKKSFSPGDSIERTLLLPDAVSAGADFKTFGGYFDSNGSPVEMNGSQSGDDSAAARPAVIRREKGSVGASEASPSGSFRLFRESLIITGPGQLRLPPPGLVISRGNERQQVVCDETQLVTAEDLLGGIEKDRSLFDQADFSFDYTRLVVVAVLLIILVLLLWYMRHRIAAFLTKPRFKKADTDVKQAVVLSPFQLLERYIKMVNQLLTIHTMNPGQAVSPEACAALEKETRAFLESFYHVPLAEQTYRSIFTELEFHGHTVPENLKGALQQTFAEWERLRYAASNGQMTFSTDDYRQQGELLLNTARGLVKDQYENRGDASGQL